jgi:glycosyltransferase involved in cell wall biosynthesis
MNILIVTGTYPPEIRSISVMVQELANELCERGHDVTVITCWPRYNLSEEAKMKTYAECTFEDRVRVIRVKTLPNHGANYILRGFAQLVSPYLFLRKIKKFLKEKIDVVIVYSPPLPYVMLGTWIKNISRAKYILNIQDIFPQNAIDLGILKNRLLIRFFEGIEKRAYESSDIITSHTSNSSKFLIEEKKVPAKKVHIIPNWIDIHERESDAHSRNFREEYGLQDKFIILFAGIFGPSQNLGYIINVAEKVADIPDICFLFVGDGIEKSKLEEMVQQKGLKNVLFRPFVLGYMAGSIPIVAFLNRESDTHAMIREARCGFSMVSGDVEKGAELLKDIYERKGELKQYGENGFRYVMNHYSKSVCIDKIEELVPRDQ